MIRSSLMPAQVANLRLAADVLESGDAAQAWELAERVAEKLALKLTRTNDELGPQTFADPPHHAAPARRGAP